MARGTQLTDLVVQLRAETGHSTLVSAGIDNMPALTQILNRVQEVLFDDYEWPFKQIQPYKDLLAGSRYYDLPTTLDLETLRDVVGWWNNQPYRLRKGIGPREYSAFNSDNDERNDPVQAWDIKFVTPSTQVEVWPIPAADGVQKLQFYGLAKLVKMVAGTDTAILDDSLIVLTAAAEILARQKDEDAPLKQKMARARYTQLRARYNEMSEPFVMGGGLGSPPSPKAPVIITVR